MHTENKPIEFRPISWPGRSVLLTAITLALPFLGVTSLAAKAETLLQRGAYLMNSVAVCGNCHTPKGPQGDLPGMELAGMENMFVVPEMTVHAPNITPDVETGIGGWTEEDLIKAIREGIRPDGSLIGPPMPVARYRDLSDRDVRALAVYVRSVPPVRNSIAKSVYNVPLPPSYGPPVTSVPEPDPADKLAYGAYLAGPVAHCTECHSPMGPMGPDLENNLGAGGMEIPGPWGVSVSANITPTGLSEWSDPEVKKMITTGTRPDGSPMMPPMPYPAYATMTAADLDAIVAYLRTLPPK